MITTQNCLNSADPSIPATWLGSSTLQLNYGHLLEHEVLKRFIPILVALQVPTEDDRDGVTGNGAVVTLYKSIYCNSETGSLTYNTLVWRYFTRQKGGFVSDLHELVERAASASLLFRPLKERHSKEVADRLHLLEPLFKDQWHLVNDEHSEHMTNTTPAGFWVSAAKMSWSPITSSDGLYFDSEADDLKDVHFLTPSFDLGCREFLRLQWPRQAHGARDHHGTRCAGQVAARKNHAWGVGIAYDSTAAGIRILGGRITTTNEATALTYGYDKVGVYSCWGPRDNGQTMNVRKAFSEGINNGWKGSIYVFASGNGGRHEDGRHEDQCSLMATRIASTL